MKFETNKEKAMFQIILLLFLTIAIVSSYAALLSNQYKKVASLEEEEYITREACEEFLMSKGIGVEGKLPSSINITRLIINNASQPSPPITVEVDFGINTQ